jgi:hypothetical protein
MVSCRTHFALVHDLTDTLLLTLLFPKKKPRHSFNFQQASSHANYSLISPLNYSVLLRRIRCCEIMFDAQTITELNKFL